MNNLDLWHHWLLLRPLLGFVLALPLIVLGLIFRGRGQSRSCQQNTEQAAPVPDQRPELRVEAGPRPWSGRGPGSDRRAA